MRLSYLELETMMKFIERIKSWIYLLPLYDWLGKRSYAQSGEDLIVWGEVQSSRTDIPAGPGLADRGPLRPGPTGFYVDIGAYHPKLFSNTYLFYKKGWRGICVDPNPGVVELYRKARPGDVFLNCGVGRGENSINLMDPRIREDDKRGKGLKELEYFMFEDGAANTFSPEQAQKNQKEAGRKLIEKRKVVVLPLKEIFEKYLPKGQRIDLLSVDVEGMDMEVLKSNDWKKYRPTMIIAEDLSFDFYKPFPNPSLDRAGRNKFLVGALPAGRQAGMNGGVVGLLTEKSYKLIAKTPYSLIFIDSKVSMKNKTPAYDRGVK